MSENEFNIIDHYFNGKGGDRHPFTTLAIGDDASLHRPAAGMELVISTDTSVQGVHWPDDFPLSQAAERAIFSALSDLAAMGAEAVAVWVNVMACDSAAIKEMAQGVSQSLKRFNVELVGGDTCRSATNALAVTVAGQLPKGSAMRRNGAKAGDSIWLVGKLGLHALGLQQWLAGEKEGDFVHHLSQIRPQIAAGIQLREIGVCCCIDVSDGLLQDAGHLATASQLAMDINLEDLPQWHSLCQQGLDSERVLEAVLFGGEDYALLFTAPAFVTIPEGLAVKIGQCREGDGVHLYRDGVVCDVKKRGFLHFE